MERGNVVPYSTFLENISYNFNLGWMKMFINNQFNLEDLKIEFNLDTEMFLEAIIMSFSLHKVSFM